MSSAIDQEQRIGTTVRSLRESRRLSVRTLATKAGFSPSFISQVENGQTSPSIASLERIVGALGVTLAEFFLPTAETVTVVRAAQRADFTSTWSRAELTMLGSAGPQRALEPMLLTLEPGGRSSSRPVSHPGEEFAFVLDGKVSLTLAESEYELASGDSVTFRAGTSHRWENPGPATARIIVVAARAPGGASAL
jgi:transcriptional regulator with XRE-family HTH domain